MALFNYGLTNVPYIGNATNPYLPVVVTNEPAPEMMPEAAPAPAPAPAPVLAGKPSVLGCAANKVFAHVVGMRLLVSQTAFSMSQRPLLF